MALIGKKRAYRARDKRTLSSAESSERAAPMCIREPAAVMRPRACVIGQSSYKSEWNRDNASAIWRGLLFFRSRLSVSHGIQIQE